MSRVHLLRRALEKDGDLASLSPPFAPYSNAVHRDSSPSSGSRISPAVLFIIVILAVLFFISGLLHLLVRFLIKRPSASAASPSGSRFPELSSSDVLQRQLQQLFHLHDSGLDQAFIDALPVFLYREIVGPKEEPFDCAVCLCEFSEKDKLRLLPVCSHAFHLSCIDTWLLSNSTCPLCRGTLYAPGFPIENPMFDFDDEAPAKTVEIEEAVSAKGVLPVRLGKFRRVNGESGVGETSNSRRLDARRCFSMGSYEYVLGESDLRVPLKPSQGEEKGGEMEGKKMNSVSKGESYSISKIWLWGKKGKFSTSSSETHSDLPASLNLDLPWMGRTQEV